MANAREFDAVITTRFPKIIAREYNRRLKAIGFGLLSDIVNGTPVDTGRARANWDIEIEDFSREVRVGEEGTGGNAGTATRTALTAAQAALQPLDRAEEIPDFIGISNNLPYIRRLEFEPGFTKKQDAGWVRGAVAAWKEKVGA